MKRTALAATTLALSMAPVLPAHSHVAPSRDTNNRYIKLAPMRDRVRLAYTVFLGELPGAQARQRMDSNRDGRLDDQEANAFARSLADSVRQNLEITVDGTAHALSWSEVHTGLGTPVTRAGAFSVDLIGWLCLPGDAADHRITLRDRFRVPLPGETELHVQASPGIAITGSAIGSGNQDARLAFQWKGSEVPLATEGYTLAFTVDPETALLPAGGPCGAARPHTAQPGRSAGMVLLLALLMLGGAWAGWRWRKARARKPPG